jgi:hypothetical protein
MSTFISVLSGIIWLLIGVQVCIAIITIVEYSEDETDNSVVSKRTAYNWIICFVVIIISLVQSLLKSYFL